MSGRVRVSVRAGGSRADLSLPGDVDVADLEPDVSEVLGVAGRLTTPAGRPLDRSTSLAGQVRDGAVLVLAPDHPPAPVVVHDDPAVAVAAAATVPWSDQESRAVRWSVGVVLALLLVATVWGWLGPVVAGGLVLGAGVVAHVRGLWFAVPGLVGGGLLLCLGLLHARTGADAAAVAVAIGAAAALGAGGVPGLALGLSVGEHVRREDVRSARRLSTSLTAAVGVALVGSAVVAPTVGPAASAATAGAALLLLVRARDLTAVLDVGAALASGAVPLATLAAGALLVRPEWHPWVALGLVLAACLVAVRPSSPVTARALDVLETVLVLAVPLLVALALGLPDLVRR